MSQYLVAIHLPVNFDPAAPDDAAMGRDIDTLNEEIVAAGGRICLVDLTLECESKSLRAQHEGKGHTSDDPYREAAEPIGGFWVLEVAGLDEALTWGRKAVLACRASFEVRPTGVPA